MTPELKEQFSKRLRDMAQVLVFEKGAIFSYLLKAIDDLTEWVDNNFEVKQPVTSDKNKCNCGSKSTGNTTVKCCNICGLPLQSEPWHFNLPNQGKAINTAIEKYLEKKEKLRSEIIVDSAHKYTLEIFNEKSNVNFGDLELKIQKIIKEIVYDTMLAEIKLLLSGVFYSPLTRYEKDVLQSAKENHIWINGMMCIRPTDEMKRDIGEQILQMLNDKNNLMLSDFDGTTFEELEQKELIVRINKS